MGEHPEPDDAALVAAANRGEEAALVGIYRRHGGFVLALARRFTGNEADALDVVQDTFAELFGRFPGFRLTSSLRAYLFPVVRNRCISLIRRRRKTVDLAAARGDPEGAGVELAWEAPEPQGLGALVAALPPGQREVIRLRFVLGMKLPEIADALDIPVGTVKSRLHLALGALRLRLDED